MNGCFDFSGKVVLVTGSSRGIGAGLVAAFAHGGARCIINYVADSGGLNQADAEKVARGLSRAVVRQADVGDTEQVKALMEWIAREAGGLDILVNNAGLLRDRSLAKMSEEEWDSVLRVNLSGTFNCLKHAAGILRDGGSVVNLASLSAQMGFYGQANYAASKAGVVALTKVAARELARRQITVNAVAPGVVRTEMTRGLPEEAVKSLLTQIPLGRFGEIDDIVPVVLFLASPLARYITGQVFHVNGGFFM